MKEKYMNKKLKPSSQMQNKISGAATDQYFLQSLWLGFPNYQLQIRLILKVISFFLRKRLRKKIRLINGYN